MSVHVTIRNTHVGTYRLLDRVEVCKGGGRVAMVGWKVGWK